MAETIVEFFAGVPEEWRVFFISMIPITELRAAIPLGFAWGMTPFAAFGWAVFGNFIPIIPLLLVLKFLYLKIIDFPRLGKPLRKLANLGYSKGDKVKRYGLLGLALLVAVPLPGTGIWTGCLVAVLFAISLRQATLAITAGMVVAGIVVTAVVYGALTVSKLVYGEWILLAIVVAALAIFALRRWGKHKDKNKHN